MKSYVPIDDCGRKQAIFLYSKKKEGGHLGVGLVWYGGYVV